MPTNPADPRTRACLELLENARVMTLATFGRDTGPWTAPVYFVFDLGELYFFSAPGSRHITEGLDRPCAASVFQDSTRAAELKGVQMTGRVHHCSGSASAVKTAAAYAVKYRMGQAADNALAYFTKAFSARFYGFAPDQVYFMDNSCGFGSRDAIRL